MYKVGRLKPKFQPINIILQDGGVGDHIASLVAIKYIENNYPWIAPTIWVPNYLVELAKHLLPKRCTVKSYSEMSQHYNPNLPTKTTKWDGMISPMKIHLLDYAFLKLCDENPSIEHKNYLQVKSNIDPWDKYRIGPYVIITTGFTAKAREFKASYINEIAKWVKDAGYTPVFLGSTKTETGAKHTIEGNFSKDIDFSIGLNLVNKTTLLEAAMIIDNAHAVLGVDNGLLHVAGCTDTPIVGGFPSVSPEIRMPVRNNILGYDFYPIVPDKGCNFCQERTNFLYGHDYRECVYKDDRSINEMTPNKFIEKLELILK